MAKFLIDLGQYKLNKSSVTTTKELNNITVWALWDANVHRFYFPKALSEQIRAATIGGALLSSVATPEHIAKDG